MKPKSSMTLDEAAAYNQGWQDAIDAAVAIAEAEAARWFEANEPDAEWSAMGVKDAICEIRKPT